MSVLRRKLADSPRQVRALEDRLMELQQQLSQTSAQNDRLVTTLREARDQIVALKEEVDRLAQPPAGFGTFIERHEDGSVDVFTGGRKLRVNVSPAIDTDELRRGQEVMLNEALNVVSALEFETIGDVVMLKELLQDGDRALVIGHTDEERIVRLAETLRDQPLRAGDSLLLEPRSGYVYERIPSPRSRISCSKKSPTSTTRTSAASASRSTRSRTRSSCRTSTPTCSASTSCAAQGRAPLRPARLRQDPDRQGRRQLPRQEGLRKRRRGGQGLLPQHQGPRAAQQVRGRDRAQIRVVFVRAKGEGQRGDVPVIVFFDEMDALFRTRGSGSPPTSRPPSSRSSWQRDRRRRGPRERHRHRRLQPPGPDRSGHPAPRPARREDQDRAARRRGGAADIFNKYLTAELAVARRGPRRERRDREATAHVDDQRTVERMYTQLEENRFLEVTYANGDKEVLYFKDFSSGAMIE